MKGYWKLEPGFCVGGELATGFTSPADSSSPDASCLTLDFDGAIDFPFERVETGRVETARFLSDLLGRMGEVYGGTMSVHD